MGALKMLAWAVRHRALTPWYLVRYYRFARLKLTQRQVVTHGMVFLGRGVEVTARAGSGRIVLGRWVHLGDGTSLRSHEGTLSIGDKVVFGRNNVVNSYLDVSIGAASIVADMVYISDFDHDFADVTRPIKDQGIIKSPVRIGPDVWLGTKVTVIRGVAIGEGSVVAANAVVTRDIEHHSVVGGVPATLIRSRLDGQREHADRVAALRDMAVKLGHPETATDPGEG